MTCPRYLALIGDDNGHLNNWCSSLSLPENMGITYRESGLILITNEACPVLTLGGGGAVLGSIFPRYGPLSKVGSWEDAERNIIRSSNGKHLVDRYWGSFLALLPIPGGLVGLRSPFSSLPCLYAEGPRITAIASDVDLLAATELFELRVDWHAMERYLRFRDLPSQDTVVAHVREIPSGTRVIFGCVGERKPQYLWHPADFTPTEPQRYDDDLGERLRRIVQNCVSSLASGSSSAVATVSGGLDSSIVAGCLTRSSVDVAAVTLATRDPSGDERAYASVLCKHLGIKLVEAEYQLQDVDFDRSVSSHRAFPSGRIHEHALRRAVARTVAKCGANSVFSGNGGDNVLYNSASVRPILDRLLVEGPIASMKTMRDVASLTGVGVVSIILEMCRLFAQGMRNATWPPDHDMLSGVEGAYDLTTAVNHPWFSPKGREPLPAKVGHIKMLLRMLHHIEGYGPDMPFQVHNPLTAQPIVEACLALPSWLYCEQGNNRAVIRRAFRSQLPAEIISRRTKAGPDSFIIELIESHEDEIHERLHYGLLAANGVLDANQISRIFRENWWRQPLIYMRLMAMLDAEAWARNLSCERPLGAARSFTV